MDNRLSGPATLRTRRWEEVLAMNDETLLATHARIQHAAFEAAYMDTPRPDLAFRGFATLVFAHAERLWAEHRVEQCERRAGALHGGPNHSTREHHAGDDLVSWTTGEQRWEVLS